MDELNMDCQDVEKFYKGKDWIEQVIAESEITEIAHKRWLTHIQQYRQDVAFVSVINKLAKEIREWFGMRIPKSPSIAGMNDSLFNDGYNQALSDIQEIFFGNESICDTAPYPQCNGANGCDTCEHQEEQP